MFYHYIYAQIHENFLRGGGKVEDLKSYTLAKPTRPCLSYYQLCFAYSNPSLPTEPYRNTVVEPVATSQKTLASVDVKPSLQTDPHLPLKKSSSRPAVRLLEVFSFLDTSLSSNVPTKVIIIRYSSSQATMYTKQTMNFELGLDGY